MIREMRTIYGWYDGRTYHRRQCGALGALSVFYTTCHESDASTYYMICSAFDHYPTINVNKTAAPFYPLVIQSLWSMVLQF